MNRNLTELVFILDRSGSMQGLEADTIGGFNAMLEKQKRDPGQVFVSTILYDDEAQVLHDRLPLAEIMPMTEAQYYVRGCTALLDALGSAIQHVSTIHKYTRPEDVPGHTLFVITTDGMENASRLYTNEQITAMIQHQKESHGWEFLFLGATIDAIGTAGRLGIDASRAANYHADAQGTRANYEAVSEAVSQVRGGVPLSTSWKTSVEKDFARRKKP